MQEWSKLQEAQEDIAKVYAGGNNSFLEDDFM